MSEALFPPEPIREAVTRYVAGAARREIPADVLDLARMCLVDWMGVALGAHAEPAAAAVRQVAARWRGQGGARLLLGGTAPPALAALVNGTMAHCMDYDDTHTEGAGHLSAPTWATVLALAGEGDHDEAALLRAFVTGYEVAARLGAEGFGVALQNRGIHPTSVFGRFAAVCAAAALLELDEERTAHALGAAATMAGGLNASFGTMAKPFHAGKAAMDGILAVELAQAGFVAATQLLDADNGLQGAFVQDRGARIQPLDFEGGWELRRNGFKPYACRRCTHPSLQAARTLAPALAGRRVARVHARVHTGALIPPGKPVPETPLEARFSLPFCIALGLQGHAAAATDFTADRLADPALMDLVRRVALEPVPGQSRYAAHLDVHLEGGETLHADTELVLGHPQNPMRWPDMETKFTAMVAPVLGEQAPRLLETLRTFGRPGDLATALALVAR